MQGIALKVIREGLGLTQGAFALELGMGREAINKMEAGKMPIERRTAYAALYLRDHPELVGVTG